MRVFLQIALLILFLAASDSSVYDDVSGYLKKSVRNIVVALPKEDTGARFKVKQNDPLENGISEYNTGKRPSPNEVHNNHYSTPKTIIRIFKNGGEFRGIDKHYPRNGDAKIKASDPGMVMATVQKTDNTKEEYRLDPVLNNVRRTVNIARRGDSSSENSGSSSLETKDWKNEWRELWLKKKIESLNQSIPMGDVVNMVAARPWGVPCGDPGQHDMPWGSCMMAIECEPEYRIYRGDFQCGRTTFICCAIQLTSYDMYQGFDVSFADSALSTDSEEQRNRGKGSGENRQKKKQRDKRKRKRERQKRKKNIKNNIKRIIKTIRKMLNRQYRNGSTQRKRKTKQLKKFIKDLKKKYREDRKSVKNLHEVELTKIDDALTKRLKEIERLNANFIQNATFRDIVVNGAINRQGARMLMEAYPELIPYFTDNTRRTGNEWHKPEDPLDYDVEYGMLYY